MTGTHDNSILSSRNIPKYTQNMAVMNTYQNIGTPMTDREVHSMLPTFELVSVRRSITNLIDAGKLAEVGNIFCPRTGRAVRTVTIFK